MTPRPYTGLLAAGLLTLGLAVPASAQDDQVAEGEKVFKKCAACHMVGPDAKNRVGPELNGVVGRTAGTLDTFKYSEAMAKAGADGLVWSEETLSEYLTNPKEMIKGNKMAFVGLKKPEERAAVIAYIEAESAEAGGS